MADYCDHGFRKGRRCPQCKPSGKRGRRRSIYENRGPVSVEGDDEARWTYLGTLDRQTGGASIDYSRANGWVPLGEYLWRR